MNLQHNSGKVLSVVAALVVVAAVSVSIWLNSPSENRARALDEERLDGLRLTKEAINDYFDIHHSLPADLKVLDSEKNQPIETNWHDPVTHQPLEYRIVGEESYSLCARFARNSEGQKPEGHSFKKHSAGRDCFEYNISLHRQ
jgi:type II secretory pathway pseudopilin PulG